VSNQAFVIALAGIGGTALSPLVAALVSRAARAHERTMAQDARNYEARREAYYEMIRNAFNVYTGVKMIADQVAGEPHAMPLEGNLPPIPTPAESDALRALTACAGSESALAELDSFNAALNRVPLDELPRDLAAWQPTQPERDSLTAKLRQIQSDMDAALARLTAVVRRELTGESPSDLAGRRQALIRRLRI
jgi:hypothetical protein